MRHAVLSSHCPFTPFTNTAPVNKLTSMWIRSPARAGFLSCSAVVPASGGGKQKHMRSFGNSSQSLSPCIYTWVARSRLAWQTYYPRISAFQQLGGSKEWRLGFTAVSRRHFARCKLSVTAASVATSFSPAKSKMLSSSWQTSEGLPDSLEACLRKCIQQWLLLHALVF